MSSHNKPHNIWILTHTVNDYNQHGSYYMCAFASKPNTEQLAPVLSSHDMLPNDIGSAIAFCEAVIRGEAKTNGINTVSLIEEVLY